MIVINGMIHGTRILHYRYANLEHEDLMEINGIVLHQTNSNSAAPTLLAYYWRNVGAHFLIGPGGAIFQTARIDRVCHHVGMIRSMCSTTHSCTPDYTKALNKILTGPGSQDEKRMAIHRMEMKKPKQSRYPGNIDSIGVELSGASDNGMYRAPTSSQNAASVWLVGILLLHFGLKREQVFRHPNISYKEATEASMVDY
jgi:N-acetylmuramoyl-L-alanine amidase CwlA